MAHSPVSCGPGRRTFSDMTYYTAPSGAGVVSVGTIRWAWALSGPDRPHHIDERGSAFERRVTDTLLRAMVAGPMGFTHPATGNLASIGAMASTSTGTGGPVSSPGG